MTATLTPDAAMLCRLIDAGDNSALGPLSDELEMAGDARAAGLRLARRLGWELLPWSATWRRAKVLPNGQLARDCFHFDGTPDPAVLHCATYDRMPGEERFDLSDGRSKTYPSRSAAYLALAEALA